MFHFVVKVVSKAGQKPVRLECKFDEFQLATMIRIFKSRNRELHSKFERFYDDVVEHGEG